MIGLLATFCSPTDAIFCSHFVDDVFFSHI